MKIISLEAENLKRLVAVEIRPDSNLVQITGKNGQGKTSVLDAIWWGLGGTRNVQAVPIRAGEEQARIKLDLGELRVTRKFNLQEDGEYTTSLIVENEAGARFGKPQDVLNAILGALTFDPLAFMRMKPEEQFDMLKVFVPGVDFAALAAADRKDFERRTDVNRQAKSLRAQADGIVLPPGPVPAVVDVAALEQKLGSAATHNTDVATRKMNRDRATARIEEINSEITRLAAERDGLQKRLAEAAPIPDLIDIGDVQLELSQAREANAAAARAAQKQGIVAQAQAAEAVALALTKAIDAREAEKQKAISKAKMPVAGIGFSGESVTLDGLPFDQASAAKQLRVAVTLAAALNPKLRIVRISDGSLLDDDAMKWLADFAQNTDLQVWIERVDGSGTVGFVIEDGGVKGAPRRAPPAPAADEVEESV